MPKLVPIKQEEAAPLPTVSGATDTDAEDEAIRERIRSLEKKMRRAELLRCQKELEDEVRSSTVDTVKGRRSRSRSSAREHKRHRHHSSSSSSSGERTPSRERRASSKWSVKRFMEERKDVKKMTPFELIEASYSWVVDDADEESLIGFIKHTGYMAGKAKSGRFVDAAHVNYDLAVRKLAFFQMVKLTAILSWPSNTTPLSI